MEKMTKKYQNRHWLYQKYIVEKLSANEIAKLCGCGKTTIFNWLEKHQISRHCNGELNLPEEYEPEEYGGTLAQIFIRDYGIDGEKIWKQYNPHVRLICHECPEYKECRGRKWKTDNCEPWQWFVEVTGFNLTRSK